MTDEEKPRGIARRIGEAVLSAVDKGVSLRWDQARRRAATASGPTLDGRVKQTVDAFARELTALGAVTGGAAAWPGSGAVTLVATASTDLGWVTLRLTDLILTIAVLHGHEKASVEERRAWVLSILAFGDTAAVGFEKLASEVGKGLGKKATSRISTDALRSINRALGRTVVTKYGTKRGVIAIGKALPFGIGAAIGSGANYMLVRTVAHQSDKFFRLMPGEPGALAFA